MTFEKFQDDLALHPCGFRGKKIEDWEIMFYIERGVECGLVGEEFDKLVAFLNAL